MFSFVRSLSLASLVGALSFGLIVPGGAQTAEKSRLEQVLSRGKVIVGTSSEAPPFGFIDEKGELVGFDIDIARLIAKSLLGGEDKVEFVKQSYAARWPNVQTGKVDFGIQVATIYPDRILQVAFTRGYVDSGITLLVRKDSPIQKTSDANNASIAVGHTGSPASRDRAKRFFPNAQETILDSTSAVISAMKIGRIAAGQFDLPVALYLAKQNPEFRVIEDLLTEPANNGIFVKQGDFTWWLTLDTLVSEMRGGSLFGEYSRIHEKWFGSKPAHARHYAK
jgi:polar amino acid transport system substrate-binding protein